MDLSEEGFLVVPRAIFTLLEDFPDARDLYLLILHKARYSGSKVICGVLEERGEWVRSLRKMSEDFTKYTGRESRHDHIHKQNTKLKNMGLIATRSTTQVTHVSVTNYEEIQRLSSYSATRSRHESNAKYDTDATRTRHDRDTKATILTTEQQNNRTTEQQNNRRVKQAKPSARVPSLPEFGLEGCEDCLNSWIEHKKEIKDPCTQRALDLIIKKYANNPHALKRDSEHSIMGGWKSIWPLKGQETRPYTNGQAKVAPESHTEKVKRVMIEMLQEENEKRRNDTSFE